LNPAAEASMQEVWQRPWKTTAQTASRRTRREPREQERGTTSEEAWPGNVGKNQTSSSIPANVTFLPARGLHEATEL